jgi:hypothetical protein
MILRAESGSEFIEPLDSASLYVLFSKNRDKGNYHLFVKRMI